MEDIVPATGDRHLRYHTRSGWWPGCRPRVESRALEQPPPANLPHGQVGLNALATAMAAWIASTACPSARCKRLFLDLSRLFHQPLGTVADQVQRVAGLAGRGIMSSWYWRLRKAPVVHADETS